jgi:hypothetical protein
LNPGERLSGTTPITTTQTVRGADRDDAAAESSGREIDRKSAGIRLCWIVGYLVAGITLFTCYLHESYTQPVTSDGASNALQAWDMLHGNILLHGWTVTDVSFYTTELPEYALVELLRGLGPGDVHVSAAFAYTLLVLVAGLVARGRATGREGLLRLLIASGIMIAPEIGPGTFILLLSPDHVGTGVPLLLTWLLLDRAPRRPYVAVVAGLLLTWVTIGDRITSLVATFPIFLICGLPLYRAARHQRDLLPAYRFELWLGISALLSVPASWLTVKLIMLLHGYAVQPLSIGIASPSAWWSNLLITGEGILGLNGADFTNRAFGIFVAVALLHLCGLALAVLGFRFGCRVLRQGGDLVTRCLTLGIAVNLVVFTLSNLPHTYWDVREIAPVLPYGAVLAGRLLAPRLGRPAVRSLLAALVLCDLLSLAYAMAQPARPARHQDLADWLANHHLSCGLASYAVANSTTLDSGGHVLVRAPTWTADGIFPGAYESSASWFSSTACDARFVVSTSEDGTAFYIPPRWVLTAFGKPVHTVEWHNYTIWIWNKNLLRMVRTTGHHASPVGGYVLGLGIRQ